MIEIAAELFANISPDELITQADHAFTAVLFRDHLYVVNVEHKIEKNQEIVRIRRYDGSSKHWDEKYNFVLSEENKDLSEKLADDSELVLSEENKDLSEKLADDSELVLSEENKDLSEKLADDSEVDGFSGAQSVAQITRTSFSCDILIFKDIVAGLSTFYVLLQSPSRSFLIQSIDGINFSIATHADFGLPPSSCLQQHLNFDDQLYAIFYSQPEMSSAHKENIPRLYVAKDTSLRDWQVIDDLTSHDVNNQGISCIAVFNGSLYVATINMSRGFQVWRKKVNPGQADAWELVLANGANRYSLNQVVFAMMEFEGELYIASGLLAVNDRKINRLYSGGFEVIRLYADDDWDIIIGTPRFTEKGLKVPLSALGPGLDDASRIIVQSLFRHQDSIYLAAQGREGFQLWNSVDGEIWSTLPAEELSRIYQVDVIATLSAPWGLILVVNTTEPNGDRSLQIWQQY